MKVSHNVIWVDGNSCAWHNGKVLVLCAKESKMKWKIQFIQAHSFGRMEEWQKAY